MYAIVPLKTCPHLSLLRPDEAPDGEYLNKGRCTLLELNSFVPKKLFKSHKKRTTKLSIKSVPFSLHIFAVIDHNSECTECHTAIENCIEI